MMTRWLGLVVALPMALQLVGCSAPTAEPTSPVNAQEMVDSLVYVQAKNGLCFGVGTASRLSSKGVSYNINMVSVDCAKVQLTPVHNPQAMSR